MVVKMFQAQGYDEIRGLEQMINGWLTEGAFAVRHVSTAMCQVATDPQTSERVQHLVITIWYD